MHVVESKGVRCSTMWVLQGMTAVAALHGAELSVVQLTAALAAKEEQLAKSTRQQQRTQTAEQQEQSQSEARAIRSPYLHCHCKVPALAAKY